MVRGIQTLQAVQKGGMRYCQNPKWIFFTNAQRVNCQRRSLWVHREHAVIWVICEGYISRCNEDARQGMSAKNHIKAAGMTPSLFISQSLRYGMTRVKCSTFALGKTLFFTKKDFCIHVMHKILQRDNFSQETGDLSQLDMEKGQHSFTSTVLCFVAKRCQQLGPKLLWLQVSCKERNEENFPAKRS